VLRERFPDTSIYMNGAALEEFRRTSGAALAAQKARAASETPANLPIPDALPATILTVDGEVVEVGAKLSPFGPELPPAIER
jgi:hypothetical protein